MSKEIFNGFDDIKADKGLVSKTKDRMLETSASKKRIPYKKVTFTLAPVVAAILVLVFILLNFFSHKVVLTANAENLMKGIEPQKIDVSNSITDSFIKSTQNFSIELFKHSIKNGENSLISPTSVFLALGMTANGADKETLDEFKILLGKYNMTIDDLNKAYKAYSEYLTDNKGSTKLNIANSIWYENNFSPKTEFLQSNANFFGADAKKLDFENKDSVYIINNWVDKNTNGKIDKIIDKIDPNDVMFLINTIYFNGKWQDKFNAGQSFDRDFYLNDGSTIKTKFMNKDGKVDYIKNGNVSGVLLPYDDNRFSLLCILPDKGININDYIKTLNENTINELISKKINTEMAVSMPKFKTSCSYELKDMLMAMGFKKAFGEGKANFSKMGNDKDGLYISSIKHKTFIKVDEAGTEAAAATSVTMSTKGALMNYISFNRPFIYAIVDDKTNLPLFIGTMENPQK